jgi:hypothetical protein
MQLKQKFACIRPLSELFNDNEEIVTMATVAVAVSDDSDAIVTDDRWHVQQQTVYVFT